MSTKETITWYPIDEQLPDECILVLIYAPILSEPIWLGHYEDGEWCSLYDNHLGLQIVTHWADLPAGPTEEAA